jgi:hypothetical protein
MGEPTTTSELNYLQLDFGMDFMGGPNITIQTGRAPNPIPPIRNNAKILAQTHKGKSTISFMIEMIQIRPMKSLCHPAVKAHANHIQLNRQENSTLILLLNKLIR